MILQSILPIQAQPANHKKLLLALAITIVLVINVMDFPLSTRVFRKDDNLLLPRQDKANRPDIRTLLLQNTCHYDNSTSPTICKYLHQKGMDQQLENLLESRQARRKLFPKHCLAKTDMENIEIIPFLFNEKNGAGVNSSIDHDLNNISLATHFSLEKTKLQRLVDIAENWDGRIAAVVYVYNQGKEEENEVNYLMNEIQFLVYFYETNLEALGSKVSIHLVIDRRPIVEEEKGGNYYPHNVLRNLAADLADTDQVLLLDVDLIPSKNSHEALKSQWTNIKAQTKGKFKKVLILPAFERDLSEGELETSVTSKDLPLSKEDLIKEVQRGNESLYRIFHSKFQSRHGATNFERWYQSDDSYQAETYEKYFEPYFVFQRTRDLPMFWEHFSGFGFDKNSGIEELWMAGYVFHVNSDAFLVHINHHNNPSLLMERPYVIHEYFRTFTYYLLTTYSPKRVCLIHKEVKNCWKYRAVPWMPSIFFSLAFN